MVAPRAQSWIKNGATWLIPALVIFASFLCPVSSHATLFDWDAAYGTWTAGAPAVGATATQAYDITGDGINDVTISISNSASNPSSGGGKFQWVGGYPTVDSTSLTGGLSPAQKALQLQVNQGNPNGVTVTITFTASVTNASFTLWDIDKTAGSFIDQISNITGLTSGGAVVAPISVTGSSANQVTGSGTNFLITGTAANASTSGGGNATITFGTTAVTSISFTWKNTDAGLGGQFIALHDIGFTPLPEVGSSLAAIVLCGGVAGFGFIQKRRRGKK